VPILYLAARQILFLRDYFKKIESTGQNWRKPQWLWLTIMYIITWRKEVQRAIYSR
jgi:hypothetical protein